MCSPTFEHFQFQAKTNSTVPPLPEEMEGEESGLRRFPARVSSRISGWKAVDYAQYTALAVTQVRKDKKRIGCVNAGARFAQLFLESIALRIEPC